MQLGQLARAMPPAWNGAEIAHPVVSPSGGTLGRMLPGKGLYLTEDLKNLGIRKPLPGVFAYSKFRRLLDACLGNQRGAIATYDAMLNARLTGLADDVILHKSPNLWAQAQWLSSYRDAGVPVGSGTYTAIPGGAVHDMTSAGAWSSLLHRPTGTDKKYLVSLGWGPLAAHLACLLVVDLLVAASNILCTSASAQTINSAALTRYTNGVGVLVTHEVTTTVGGTAQTITLNKYSNQDGTANRTTPSVLMTASAGTQTLAPAALGPFMQLADGDYGVRSVEEITFSAANSAGILALNLYYPLIFLPGLDAGTFAERDFVNQVDALIELVHVGGVLGCLTSYYLCPSTGGSGITYHLRTVEG